MAMEGSRGERKKLENHGETSNSRVMCGSILLSQREETKRIRDSGRSWSRLEKMKI